MREISREWLEFLREQYPKGSRVRLTEMGNDPHPVPPGSMGTLDNIDDAGQFHVKWDNGSGLALIIGEDRFQILPPEPQTLKFYMPLTAQLYAYDDWGDLEEYGNDLDGRELRDYQSCIHKALLENQMPEEKNRGLMHWYDKPDGVNTKVQSVMLDVESRDGQLWGVAECKVNGTLLPEEKEALAEYISGQASDGWGEGFEQRAIKLNDGELYVSLWNSSNWSIQTEEERFSPDSLTRLPDLCWSVLPGEGTLICIKRGESGYRVSFSVCPIKNGVLIGLPRQLVQLLQLLPQSAHRADGGGVISGQRCLKEEGIRQRQPPSCPTEQRPHPLLVRCKTGDQRMLPEVPVLLHSGRHRLIVCMAGGHQQHSAEGIPIRLVGVIGLLIILRPGSIGGLARLRNGAQDLIPPVLHRRLDLSRGHFFLVISSFSIRRDFLKAPSIFLRPLLNNSFPVVRIVSGQCSGVDVKSHSDTSFFAWPKPFQGIFSVH